MSVVEIVDKIATEFEEYWSENLRFEDLIQFANINQMDNIVLDAVLPELIMIDLERRYQNIPGLCAKSNNASEVYDYVGELLRAEDYLKKIEEFGRAIPVAKISEILDHEFVVRARFGDMPAPRNKISNQAIRKVNKLRPRLRVCKTQRRVFSQLIWGRIWIGRQNIGEPCPFKLSEFDGVPKLVCAEAKDSRVSRSQLELQMMTPLYVLARNHSTNRHVAINDGVLAPGGLSKIRLPLVIELDATSITLETQNPN